MTYLVSFLFLNIFKTDPQHQEERQSKYLLILLFHSIVLLSFKSELKHQESLMPAGFSFPTSGGAEQRKKKKKISYLPDGGQIP